MAFRSYTGEMGITIATTPKGLLQGFTEFLCRKCLEQCLALS